jgi:hypothetical protein
VTETLRQLDDVATVTHCAGEIVNDERDLHGRQKSMVVLVPLAIQVTQRATNAGPRARLQSRRLSEPKQHPHSRFEALPCASL